MKILRPNSLATAQKIIGKTGADQKSWVIMAQKAIGLTVELPVALPAAQANILKQEALAVGADAAVHAKTISCEIPQTKVILIGTLSQLFALAQKLKFNIPKIKKYGQQLTNALHAKFLTTNKQT